MLAPIFFPRACNTPPCVRYLAAGGGAISASGRPFSRTQGRRAGLADVPGNLVGEGGNPRAVLGAETFEASRRVRHHPDRLRIGPGKGRMRDQLGHPPVNSVVLPTLLHFRGHSMRPVREAS